MAVSRASPELVLLGLDKGGGKTVRGARSVEAVLPLLPLLLLLFNGKC